MGPQERNQGDDAGGVEHARRGGEECGGRLGRVGVEDPGQRVDGKSRRRKRDEQRGEKSQRWFEAPRLGRSHGRHATVEGSGGARLWECQDGVGNSGRGLTAGIGARDGRSQFMIEVEGLTKVYGQFLAVKDLSFGVRPGEVLGLVGPNGAGKTSTLRCLSGIIPPTRGVIRHCGHDLATDPVAAKRTLAWLPDEPRLFEYLTVWEHLVFSARIHQVSGFEPKAMELLAELELNEKRDALPGELSRGMCQKLSIACGLLHAPRVLIFDEPLTGLDPLGIRRMKDSILRRAREGAAVIISSHLLHLLEEVCSHVLILRRGELVTSGALGEILARFRSEQPDASLEEIFLRVIGTGAGEGSGPCP